MIQALQQIQAYLREFSTSDQEVTFSLNSHGTCRIYRGGELMRTSLIETFAAKLKEHSRREMIRYILFEGKVVKCRLLGWDLWSQDSEILLLDGTNRQMTIFSKNLAHTEEGCLNIDRSQQFVRANGELAVWTK